MLQLPKNPTLADVQKYVQEMEKERGFSEYANMHTAFLLGEELGELFKAIRKAEKLRIDKNSKVTSVAEELADILIYISSLATRYGISLEQAFRDKEEINKKREWK